jgi:hypothetical protein
MVEITSAGDIEQIVAALAKQMLSDTDTFALASSDHDHRSGVVPSECRLSQNPMHWCV